MSSWNKICSDCIKNDHGECGNSDKCTCICWIVLRPSERAQLKRIAIRRSAEAEGMAFLSFQLTRRTQDSRQAGRGS